MPLERPTLLVLATAEAPASLVPMLERPLAAAAPGGRRARAPRVARRGGSRTRSSPDGCRGRPDRRGRSHLGRRTCSRCSARVPGAAWTSARAGRRRHARSQGRCGDRRAPSRRRGRRCRARRRSCRGPFAGRTRARDRGRACASCSSPTATTAPTFTIVASGPNAASPHHEPTERTIEPATRSSSTSVACSTATTATRHGRCRSASPTARALAEVHAVVRGRTGARRRTSSVPGSRSARSIGPRER